MTEEQIERLSDADATAHYKRLLAKLLDEAQPVSDFELREYFLLNRRIQQHKTLPTSI